jgi:hypothetical protein
MDPLNGAYTNVKVKINTGEWVSAHNYQLSAFKGFKNADHNIPIEMKYDYDNNGIKFTVSRIGDQYHGGIYITRDDGTIMPIANWNDVKVFLLDQPIVNWYVGIF